MTADRKIALQVLKKIILQYKIAYRQIAMITGLKESYIRERLKDKQDTLYITEENLQLLQLKISLLVEAIEKIRG